MFVEKDRRGLVLFDPQEEDIFISKDFKRIWNRRGEKRGYINLGLRTELEIKLMRMEIEQGTFKVREWRKT